MKRRKNIREQVGAKAARVVLDTMTDDDTPDGAYFAMAEELGLDAADFGDEELLEEEE